MTDVADVNEPEDNDDEEVEEYNEILQGVFDILLKDASSELGLYLTQEPQVYQVANEEDPDNPNWSFGLMFEAGARAGRLLTKSDSFDQTKLLEEIELDLAKEDLLRSLEEDDSAEQE